MLVKFKKSAVAQLEPLVREDSGIVDQAPSLTSFACVEVVHRQSPVFRKGRGASRQHDLIGSMSLQFAIVQSMGEQGDAVPACQRELTNQVVRMLSEAQGLVFTWKWAS